MNNKKAVWICRAAAVVFLFIVCGIYGVRTVFYNRAEDILTPVSYKYTGSVVRLNNPEFGREEVDKILKEKDDEYKGYLSTDAVLNADVLFNNGKSMTEEIVILNPSVSKTDICKDIVAAEGVKAYVCGWQWKNVAFGEKIKLELNDINGQKVVKDVTLAGTAQPERLYRVVVGTRRLAAHKGMLVIDGLNLYDYIENSNADICFYTNDIPLLGTLGAELDSSIQSEQELDLQMNEMAARIKFSNYNVYLVVILVCVSLLAVWFLGGTYRFVFYAGYGIGFIITAVTEVVAKIKSDFLYKYLNFSGAYYIFLFSTLGAALVLAGVSFLLWLNKRKRIRKVITDDTTTKYI